MRFVHTGINRVVVRRVVVALGISVALASSIGAQGQPDRGAIAGTVLDPVGAAAAKVVVQARSADGQTVRRTTSEGTGKYTLADLPPGSYEISVTIPGLMAYQQKNVRVQAAATAAVDIHLEEGTQLSTLGEDPLGIVADVARHAPPAGPTPRTADGKPDLSGVWWSPVTVVPGNPEWLPAAQQTANQRQANNRVDSPQLRCLPSGVLRRGPLIEFVQSKAFLIEISDDDSPGFHQIYLDGRGHPKEPDPLWYGDSIGRWEGDTLVLDATSFVDSTWLGRGGLFHSENMHVVERFTRQGDVILYDVTVEDPTVLVEPWVLPTRTLRKNANPDAGLLGERGNCEVYETNSISSQIRH